MPESGNKDELPTDREKGHCPVCGEPADEVTQLTFRVEDGEKRQLPGMHYDHTGTHAGPGSCIEWADGETEQN
jgi:hypothetical protein